jgi:uncharacterized protein YjiS (DUF1127 family)
MIMSTSRSAAAAEAFAAMVRSSVDRAARQAIELGATFIMQRAERRLLRELESFNARLLDDCGIGRAGISPRHGGGTARHAPRQRLR